MSNFMQLLPKWLTHHVAYQFDDLINIGTSSKSFYKLLLLYHNLEYAKN